MKGKVVFGALLVSVALCSQGFGFELLGRLLGLNCGGCGTCNTCAAACEEPAACEAACPQACEPACPKACEPACPKACEAACPEACEPACAPRCGKKCDLFSGLKGLFACKSCNNVGCNTGCNTGCVEACAPEPACEAPRACAAPQACEAPVACVARCPKRICHRPLLGLLDNLFGCLKCKGRCGCGSCAPSGCETACGCGECGGGEAAAPAAAPSTAPAAAPAEEAAPLPKAPTADPSASLMRSRSIYQASRTIVRN